MRPVFPRPPFHARAAVASLLLHAALLLAMGRWYAPARPPPRRMTAAEPSVVFMDVLPPATPPAIVPGPESRTPTSDVPSGAATGPATLPGDTPGSAPPPVTPLVRPTATAAALRPGFSDSRLHLRPGALRPEPRAPTLEQSFRAALQADEEARARAERDDLARRQVTLFGRKVTVFGDSSKVNWTDLTVIFSGKRAVLPTDGREWEDLELRKQSADFVRDSILRERARRVRR